MSEQPNPAPATTQAGDGNSGKAPQAEAPKVDAPKAEAAAAQPEAPKEAKPEVKEQPQGEKPAVPEKYELKLPEGSQLDAAHVEKVAAYAKERGLSNEQAQAVLERESQAVSGFIEGSQNQLKEQSTKWVEELKQDKDVGGDSFNKSAELAKRFVSRFGDDSLKDALDQTGLGNHPGLFKMIVRAAKLMSEDQLVLPNAQPSAEAKRPEDVLYGNN